MANIHVGQTAVRLEFTVGIDLTSASEIEIRFEKPNTVKGSFPGAILNAEKGIVYYDVQSEGDLDDTGVWYFWAHILFDDDTELDSNPTRIQIYEPGKRYLSHPYGRMSIDGGVLMAIEAFRVIYNNNLSNLSADDVQAALDEIKNLVDTLAAADVDYSNAQSQLSANNVKGALDELKSITDDLASNLGSEFQNVVHVAKNGSDTPPEPGIPLGTIDNPFLTVQAAIDSISSPDSNDFYTILVQPGNYNENLSMKPWVNIVGLTKDGTKIEGGGTHTCWYADGGRVTVKDISLGSQPVVVTHPTNAPGSSAFSLRNVNLGSLEVNFLGAEVDFIQMRNDVVIENDCTIHSAWVSTFDTTIRGTFSLDDQDSQHSHTSGYDSYSYLRGITANNISFSGNTYVEYFVNQTRGTISIDGSQCVLRADAGSLTKAASDITITNGGSLEKVSGAHSVHYDNSTSGLTATDVQDAIDELRTLI